MPHPCIGKSPEATAFGCCWRRSSAKWTNTTRLVAFIGMCKAKVKILCSFQLFPSRNYVKYWLSFSIICLFIKLSSEHSLYGRNTVSPNRQSYCAVVFKPVTEGLTELLVHRHEPSGKITKFPSPVSYHFSRSLPVPYKSTPLGGLSTLRCAWSEQEPGNGQLN